MVHGATLLPINANYAQIPHLPQLIEKLVFIQEKHAEMEILGNLHLISVLNVILVCLQTMIINPACLVAQMNDLPILHQNHVKNLEI